MKDKQFLVTILLVLATAFTCVNTTLMKKRITSLELRVQELEKSRGEILSPTRKTRYSMYQTLIVNRGKAL